MGQQCTWEQLMEIRFDCRQLYNCGKLGMVYLHPLHRCRVQSQETTVGETVVYPRTLWGIYSNSTTCTRMSKYYFVHKFTHFSYLLSSTASLVQSFPLQTIRMQVLWLPYLDQLSPLLLLDTLCGVASWIPQAKSILHVNNNNNNK